MWQWITWWCSGWRQHMHSSWPLPVALQLDHRLLALLELTHRHWLDSLYGIVPTPIPAPKMGITILIALQPAQWHRLLQLVYCICAGHKTFSLEYLTSQDKQWCRRVAKGLKPGLWLPASFLSLDPITMAILLLRDWLGPAVWTRMRFCFGREKVEEVETISSSVITEKILNPLWQAVITHQVNRA